MSATQSPSPVSSRGRLATAPSDAAALICLLDAALAILPGHSSIGEVFFRVPAWAPLRPAWPAVFGLAILLRFRPMVFAATSVALFNTAQYFGLLGSGRISGLPVCFSAAVALTLVPLLRRRCATGEQGRRPLAPAPAVVCAAGLLLLGHILTFGSTDYRRRADAVVVFGARVYPSGRPADALADRMRTGIHLYKQGYADRLVLSGAGREPAAMRQMALAAGVPEEAIIMDDRGVNTAATLASLRGRLGRVLAVSHYFHNARIKLAAGRFGLECLTVPAKMPRRLRAEPYFVARECAAFVAYYLQIR